MRPSLKLPSAILLTLALAAGTASASIQLENFGSPGETISLAGDAIISNNLLRLTPAKSDRSGAAWFREKQQVASGFETTFQFRLTKQGGLGHGADGFAFVLQNAGSDALGGRGSAGGFAISDTRYRKRERAIPWSVAVFFDTFKNGGRSHDPSDNYLGIFTAGRPSDLKWPAPRLAFVPSLAVHLRDQKVHTARIRFRPPYLSVYLDDLTAPVLTSIVDLSIVMDSAGSAWVGFTASTGGGYQNHEILSWSFAAENVNSGISVVSSQISFQPADCLPDRELCTPERAVIEAHGTGYRVVLPGNLEWAASIANPAQRDVVLTNAHGIVCWKNAAGSEECSGPASTGVPAGAHFLAPNEPAGALITKTHEARTWFSVNGQMGAMRNNQGVFEFDVDFK